MNNPTTHACTTQEIVTGDDPATYLRNALPVLADYLRQVLGEVNLRRMRNAAETAARPGQLALVDALIGAEQALTIYAAERAGTAG
ncbi:hypothetical protein [Streptomyces albidoflavus]|uniref:hypothetical protein n=1 Tax=Streptomyces albidoflavus TaxID=1886 RepID=UPI00331D3A9B